MFSCDHPLLTVSDIITYYPYGLWMVSSDGKYAYLLPINIKNNKINDVFYRALYIDTIRRNPNIDFIVSGHVLAAGGRGLVNGLTGLKWASDTYVLMHPRHIHRLSAMTAPSQPPFNISHSAPEQLWLFCW